MKYTKYIVAGCIALMGATTSCVGDLDLTPDDPNKEISLTTTAEWDGFLARIYANFYRDDIISCSDGGAGTFTRTHFNLNELVADECFISDKWNDPGYVSLNFCTWSGNNEWIYAAFAREFFNAKMCAEFIYQMENGGSEFLLSQGVSQKEIDSRIAEAHALRGLSYYYMIDLYGRGPWLDENSVTGAIPPTYERTELFNAITAELIANNDKVLPAAEQEYPRINREAAYMILAKLYLNAEVYTGTAMYDKCAQALKNVVETGLYLAPEYKYLFCASNDKYVNKNGGELLFVVPQQQGRMETWGGTTYLTAGAWIETVPPDVLKSLNAHDTWSGLRLRPELSRTLAGDPRRLIYEGTFQEAIPDLASFDAKSCGYMLIKYTNTTEDDYYNEAGESNNNVGMSNTDYPMLRLADAYLMLAECELHNVKCDGLNYLNKVRARVGLEPLNTLSPNIVLAERQKELYMEGHRRSDLIRFGRYTGSTYLWSWKNGVYEGGAIPEYRALFPIPNQYVGTVGQNPGY